MQDPGKVTYLTRQVTVVNVLLATFWRCAQPSRVQARHCPPSSNITRRLYGLKNLIVRRAVKSRRLTVVVACWCIRISECVSGILVRTSVYFGHPENSTDGNRTTAMSPDVFDPDIRNLTHCASSTTAIRRSLGSGNLLAPVLPAG